MADANAGIAITDSDPDLFIARANAYRRQRALDKARADYESALRLEPNASAPYVGRGNVRAMQGDFDGALADYDAAIKLNPKDAGAYLNRATAQSEKGDYTGAAVTSDAAVRQWPNDVNLYANRGFTRFAAGDFAGATADFQRAGKDVPTNAYVPLWRYLAQARVGGDKDTTGLARDFANVDQSAWPAAVYALYLGKGTPDAVRVAASAGDSSGKAERECEAAFYLGEFALLNGKRDEAAPLLREAADKCPVGFTERYAARGELGRSP